MFLEPAYGTKYSRMDQVRLSSTNITSFILEYFVRYVVIKSKISTVTPIIQECLKYTPLKIHKAIFYKNGLQDDTVS